MFVGVVQRLQLRWLARRLCAKLTRKIASEKTCDIQVNQLKCQPGASEMAQWRAAARQVVCHLLLMVFSVVSLSCVVSALLSSFTRRTNYSLDRRLLLGIRWNDRVRNDEVLQTDRTGQALQVLSSMAYSSRFGHAARLGRRDTAVSKALHFLVDTSLLLSKGRLAPVSYTHLRAHETGRNLVCRLLLEKKK